ncbi:hypothetical protein V1527DRAFT_61945 [Lipomyces starkeyi]
MDTNSNSENTLPLSIPVSWNENNFALTFKFLQYLRDHDFDRQSIWPHEGEKSTGQKKVKVCQKIAEQFFSDISPYKDHMNKEAYGKAVYNKIRSLEKEARSGTVNPGTGAGVEDYEKAKNIRDEIRLKIPYVDELCDLVRGRTEIIATVGMCAIDEVDLSVIDAYDDGPIIYEDFSQYEEDFEGSTRKKSTSSISTPTATSKRSLSSLESTPSSERPAKGTRSKCSQMSQRRFLKSARKQKEKQSWKQSNWQPPKRKRDWQKSRLDL